MYISSYHETHQNGWFRMGKTWRIYSLCICACCVCVFYIGFHTFHMQKASLTRTFTDKCYIICFGDVNHLYIFCIWSHFLCRAREQEVPKKQGKLSTWVEYQSTNHCCYSWFWVQLEYNLFFPTLLTLKIDKIPRNWFGPHFHTQMHAYLAIHTYTPEATKAPHPLPLFIYCMCACVWMCVCAQNMHVSVYITLFLCVCARISIRDRSRGGVREPQRKKKMAKKI
jgi:hypothetical protein